MIRADEYAQHIVDLISKDAKTKSVSIVNNDNTSDSPVEHVIDLDVVSGDGYGTDLNVYITVISIGERVA